MKAIGITVLHNKAVPLKLTGENRVTTGKSSTGTLYIAGLGAAWPKNSKPGKALEDVPNDSPRIVMMHNPNTFGKLPAESASFAVAGHTHGGQFRIPFLPESSYLTYKKEEEVHADGWIDGYGASGNNLYVNRGIGFSDLPLRINAMPEVTLFTLKSL
ncbi:MAG TPA: hypothetical protein DCR24_06035 [Bacillus bacterium]|nr:hypothetical protein [Bacillus sp. (in: firmicutes)]